MRYTASRVSEVSTTAAESETAASKRKARWAKVFGWLSGGSLGLLIDYGLFAWLGSVYPVAIGTFVLFGAGALSGLTLGEKLGPKAFLPLGISSAVLLTALMVVLATAWG